MLLSHVFRITVHLLLVARGVLGINSPPVLRSEKTWYVTEDEEVGSVVTRLQAYDQENDHVVFTLEPQLPGQVVHTRLEIDDGNRVKVAKPLTGLAGSGEASYILRVRLDDGFREAVTEVRLEVSKSGQGGARHQQGSRDFGVPGNYGSPSNFGIFGGFRPPIGPIPSPDVESGPAPFLKVNQTWEVNGDAAVGTEIDKVSVQDFTGEGYSIVIEQEQSLVMVDSHLGHVIKVATPLHKQVGVHHLNVTASYPHGKVSEPVVLRVLPPQTSTVSLPTSESPRAGIYNQQDLRVVGGSGNVAGSTGSTSAKPSTELPIEIPTPDVSLTVIPIVVVVSVLPLLMALYCCWRRHRKKVKAQAKESAVVYSDKGEEAAATEITPVEPGEQPDRGRRRGSSILGLSALWRIRAQSNTYEDSIRGGSGKRKVSELSSSTTDVWEFPRHRLKIMGILGEGCFGQVWKCEALGLKGEGSKLVAVKTLKESAGERERRDLIQELKVLMNLGRHPNVVSLLGCCTEKDPIFVILEYMVGGKLQSYLRASRADTAYNNLHGSSSSLTPKDLTLFTYQIARGMEFLVRNGIIHRDLAARNILVGEEKICKVADFGFARDVANNRVYERKSDGRLPIRWMAPESLFDNIFTTKSDVWSFGVLLWEIVTLGSTPYPGLGAVEVMRKVKDGYRLEKPDHCRREVYNIMYYCWDKDPKERPSFTELVHTLEGLLMSEVEYIELDRFPDHTYYNVITEKSDELL
ncbi:tyrosine kinase receptor Cad96Ca [Procambarus clarkii]|uniref:tyrosine kinase receptor Cad96Ca n=1 Tax=Procambarus clarkii TaxID=6728 RepID=UPI001E6788D2|nr:tyrosine kinase receptor Cad96Ca-like [Procambarus clarkii]XP_045616172.1 tyrosine kinase receptor Cad96Ca-like [Procambarus clarkii]